MGQMTEGKKRRKKIKSWFMFQNESEQTTSSY